MADTKISALPAGSPPYVGTELIPLVSGGVDYAAQTKDIAQTLAPPFARARVTSPATCNNGSATTIIGWTTIVSDTNNMFSNSGRITFNTAGIYTVGATLRFTTTYNVGGLAANLLLRLNGSTRVALDEGAFGYVYLTGSFITLNAITTRHFNAADYCELIAEQWSGHNITPQATSDSNPEMWACWHGNGG